MSLSIPLATGPSRPTTEASLFYQAQADCRDSLDRLMTTHDGLVQAVVRRQVLGQLPFAEAVQAGRLGLWRAICRYTQCPVDDPQRGVAFSTYARPAIQRSVWRAVQVYHRPPTPPPAHAAHSTTVQDPAQVWETACLRMVLYDLVARLPTPRLRYIVVRRYGLAGQPPATYQQIGAVLGLSGERVRQLHTAALVPARPMLAQRLGWTSARGWCPFDPVSIFLLLGWQLTQGWNRTQTLRHPRYADYAQVFGFCRGRVPHRRRHSLLPYCPGPPLRHWRVRDRDRSGANLRRGDSIGCNHAYL